MGIPQFHNEGVDQNGTTTSVTPSFSGFTWSANDIIEIVFVTDGTIPTLTTANGFALAQDPAGNPASASTSGGTAGAAECAVVVFWKRAAGSTTATDPPPVINTNGATCWCLQPNSFSGARTSGTPYTAITSGIVSTATASVTSQPATWTLANCLLMPRVASSNDDQAFNSWTMSGSAGPSGTGAPNTGWHNGNGNACAFTGDEGGYATAPSPGQTATTTFAASTKQAMVTLVMASVAEPVNPGWMLTRVDQPPRRALPAAVLAGLVAPVMAIGTPPAAPPLSWAPTYADSAPRARAAPIVGGMSAPETVIANQSAPALSWAPDFPDQAQRARAAPIVGGMTAPDATLPNTPAPLLSWAPRFPDSAQRARQPVIPGGSTQPDATLSNTPAPALSWRPTFPDQAPRARQPVNQGGAFAPVKAIAAPSSALSIGATAFFQKANTTTPNSGSITTRAAYPAWAPSTTYAIRTDDRVTNAGNTYECANSANTGTSASSGGPTTTPAPVTNGAITDGTTHWNFLQSGTGAVDTQTSNSLFLVSSGQGNDAASGTTPNDNKGNSYTIIGSRSFFVGFPQSSAATYASTLPATGGNGHTFTGTFGIGLDGGGDEKTLAAVEVVNGAVIIDHSSVEANPNGSNVCTSNPVTTTNAAILVCFCWLNGGTHPDGFLHTAVPGSGFALLPQASGLLEIGNTAGQVQMCTIWKAVASPGTYTATLTTAAGLSEGAVMHLIAVQATSAPALPDTSWLPRFPDAAPGRRQPPNAGGPFAPVASLSAAPPLSWTPSFPDAAVRPRHTQPAGVVAPPTDISSPLTWSPIFPERALGRPRVEPAGVTAPPTDTTTAPLAWSPEMPDAAPGRPRLALSEAVGPVATLPNAPAPVLSWVPSYPDAAPRARGAPIVGGSAQPEATIPNPPAPPLSWAPVVPTYQLRHRQRTSLSEGSATLPIFDAPALSWAPIFPDQAFKPHAAPIVGGSFAPDATIPNLPAPPLAWLASYPDAAYRAPAAPIRGGMVPDDVLPRVASGVVVADSSLADLSLVADVAVPQRGMVPVRSAPARIRVPHSDPAIDDGISIALIGDFS